MVEPLGQWHHRPRSLVGDDKQLRDTQTDYASEFLLRDLQPPHSLVRDGLDKMTAAVKEWMQSLTQEQEDDLEHTIGKDFGAF
jgi:hypothetical protein